MNCLYHLKQTNLFRLLTLAIFGVVATAVSAATVDLGELEFDKEYSIPADFNDYTCHVTVTKSGTLTYYNKTVSFSAYSDEEMENGVGATYIGYVNGAQAYTFSAEAGKTYYFSLSNFGNEGTFKVSLNDKLSLNSTTVADGGTLSVGGSGTIEYVFNQTVTVSSVTISAGKLSAPLVYGSDETAGYRINESRLVVNFAGTLNEWYNNGTLKAGDEVTVSITGIKAALDETMLYNGDGNATFKYVAASKPVTLVSATTADGKYTLKNGGYADCDFLSYFSKNDNSGKYVFTFSDALNVPTNLSSMAYLIWGENQEGDVQTYQEYLPVEFSNDNKTITIDCTGKSRTVKEMGGTNFGYITLRLMGVKSTDGQLAYTGTSANQGSYSFSFYYKEATVAEAIAEFDPESEFGTSETLTINIANYDQISYSGIKFAWRENGVSNEVVVAKENLTIKAVENDARIIVTIPEAARTAKNVVVSFTDLTFSDIDYSSNFTATFNAATYTVCSECSIETYPSDMEEVEEISDVMVSFSDHSYVYYNEGTAYLTSKGGLSAIALPTPTLGKLANRMTQNLGGNTENAGSYTVTFPEGYFIFDDNTISAEFSVSFTVVKEEGGNNTTSAVNFTSTPANGSTVESCEEIDIIFPDYNEVGIGGGNATISKDGGDAVKLGDARYGTAYNEAIQSLGETAAEAGTYVVSFPAGYFILDDNDSPAFTITFTVAKAEAKEIKVVYTPATGSTVESCNVIELTFPDYEGVSQGEGKATIWRRGGDVVELGDTEWGIEFNQINQPLGDNATADGFYIVTFPDGYFQVSETEDSEPIAVPAFTITFIVESPKTNTFDIVSSPANGETVEACNEIQLTFNGYMYAGLSQGKATIAKDGGESVQLSDAGYGVEENQMVQSLDGKASADGTYTVTFPNGYFLVGVDYDSDPIDVPEFTVTFTVSTTTGVSNITVAGEGAAEYFNLNGVKVSEPANGVFIVKRGNTITKQVIK